MQQQQPVLPVLGLLQQQLLLLDVLDLLSCSPPLALHHC
jgi:hypothetical protein